MRSIALLTLLTALGAWAVVRNLPAGAACAAVTARPTETVHSIAFDGGPGLPLAQLHKQIATRVGASIDSAQLERDRAALQTWLAGRGYLAAKVGSPSVTFDRTGGACVVFDVERGPLFHLRTVKLEGPGWADAGVLTIAPGDEAVGDRIARSRQTAEATLARHGKHLSVELIARPDLAEAALDVTLVTR
jgi:hypothetical protein